MYLPFARYSVRVINDFDGNAIKKIAETNFVPITTHIFILFMRVMTPFSLLFLNIMYTKTC